MFQLYLFTQKQYVDRRKVSSVINLPTEEVKEIFTGIAKLRYKTGWELLLPADHAFIEKYPDVMQRQQLFWEAKQKQFNDLVSDSLKQSPRQRRKSKSASEETIKQNGLKRDRDRTISGSASTSNSGDNEIHHVPKKLKTNHKSAENPVKIKDEPMESL